MLNERQIIEEKFIWKNGGNLEHLKVLIASDNQLTINTKEYTLKIYSLLKI